MFGGLPESYQNYTIELAHSERKSSSIKYATHVPVSRIDRAVETACFWNGIVGYNVYADAALRKAGCGDKRSGADNIVALTSLYVDLDSEASTQNAPEKYRHCPPTGIVTTGRIPHLRQQLWWRLDEPLHDLEATRQHLETLCTAFDSDPAVNDVARLMRLGGTVAYPKKKGRVPELTEFTAYDGDNDVQP